MVKNLPAKQETWVQSWGQEDPLAKEMVFHSSIFALETPWTEEPGRLQSMSSPKESDTTLWLNIAMLREEANIQLIYNSSRVFSYLAHLSLEKMVKWKVHII